MNVLKLFKFLNGLLDSLILILGARSLCQGRHTLQHARLEVVPSTWEQLQVPRDDNRDTEGAVTGSDAAPGAGDSGARGPRFPSCRRCMHFACNSEGLQQQQNKLQPDPRFHYPRGIFLQDALS